MIGGYGNWVMGNAVGQPMLTIEEDQLSFFVDYNFKVKDMALMLGCSKRTIEIRLSAYVTGPMKRALNAGVIKINLST